MCRETLLLAVPLVQLKLQLQQPPKAPLMTKVGTSAEFAEEVLSWDLCLRPASALGASDMFIRSVSKCG